MRISPLDIERAPRSRVREWERYWAETAAYRSWLQQEAEWKARTDAERMN